MQPLRVEEWESRLQRLEDLDAIAQLFIDYGRYLDAGDFDSYAALFAEDGEILPGRVGRARGREAIEALMAKALAGLLPETLRAAHQEGAW